MELKELYRQFRQHLGSIYSEGEADLISSWVFESVAGIKKYDLLANPSIKLDEKISSQLDNSLNQLLKHKPVQYVLGEAWFYKMKFKVNEAVLVPRPETEELVELISQSTSPGGSMIDIGTGSGCIAIALKKLQPRSRITAVDVSEAALDLAKKNATRLNAEIDFKQLDFLDELNWANLPSFDVIASNPPYIPQNEQHVLDKNVTDWEPHLALFVPDGQPLLFYEKIARFGKTHLKEAGKIFVELHEQYARQTAAMFEQDYVSVEIKKDIYGKERMLIAF